MEIEEGVTLLEAAERAGIYLNSLCGGEGVCGKCRVRIASGNAKPDKHSIAFFTKEEIQQGYVLAVRPR